MGTESRYSELLRQFPNYMSKDQMYRACHISKKTCLFLLENGLVPCIDSGKKTRRFKIETSAVIRYLEDRDLHPELYKAPEGFYKKKQCEPWLKLTEANLLLMHHYYDAVLEPYPDVLSIAQISEYTGYGKSSVVRWCSKQQLKSFNIKGCYRKAGYSKKFLAEHESDILLHKEAKKYFDDAGLKKLPTIKEINSEYAELISKKKTAYAEYRKARDEMKELLIVKANVDRILGIEKDTEIEKDEPTSTRS